MSTGFIYCFSNPSMPGLLKVGMTERTPKARLSEANTSDTWRLHTPYKFEFAKKVAEPKQKERKLHSLLERFVERVNPRYEFFRVSNEDVLSFFDLMDGEMWAETCVNEEEEEEEDYPSDPVPQVKTTRVKGCRNMKKCFTHGQRIRHECTPKIGKKFRIGTYDSSDNKIVFDGEKLSLNKFVVNHYKKERPDRKPNANAWYECECEVDGKWISTYSLPTLRPIQPVIEESDYDTWSLSDI